MPDKKGWALEKTITNNFKLWIVYFISDFEAKNSLEALIKGQGYFSSIQGELTFPDSDPCIYGFNKQQGYAVFASTIGGLPDALKI